MTTFAETLASEIIAMNKDFDPAELRDMLEGKVLISDLEDLRDLLFDEMSSNEMNAARFTVETICEIAA